MLDDDREPSPGIDIDLDIELELVAVIDPRNPMLAHVECRRISLPKGDATDHYAGRFWNTPDRTLGPRFVLEPTSAIDHPPPKGPGRLGRYDDVGSEATLTVPRRRLTKRTTPALSTGSVGSLASSADGWARSRTRQSAGRGSRAISSSTT